MIHVVEGTREATVGRLRPLLRAVQEALVAGVAVSHAIHRQHSWQPAADPHLDRQLVRRHAMEQLRPWAASVGEQLTFDVGDSGSENFGLPMSGLIITTETDVARVWHSDDGELPPADTSALRTFYAQTPTTQLALHGLSVIRRTAGQGSAPGVLPTPRTTCQTTCCWSEVPRTRGQLAGTTTSSGRRSPTSRWPNPRTAESMPLRRMSSTFSTPACPFAARPHR